MAAACGSVGPGSVPPTAPREVAVPTYQAFAPTDLLDGLAVERMLAKLSTRRYQVGLEPVGTRLSTAGTSRSAVSRRFVARYRACPG